MLLLLAHVHIVHSALKLSTDHENGEVHETLEVGSSFTSRFILITNTEAYPVPVRITAQPVVSWLSLSDSELNVKPMGTTSFSITLAPSDLTAAKYVTSVTIHPLLTDLEHGVVDLNDEYLITATMNIVDAKAQSHTNTMASTEFLAGSALGVLLTMCFFILIFSSLVLRKYAFERDDENPRVKTSGLHAAQCCYISLPFLRSQLHAIHRKKMRTTKINVRSTELALPRRDASVEEERPMLEKPRTPVPCLSSESLESFDRSDDAATRAETSKLDSEAVRRSLLLTSDAKMNPSLYETQWQVLEPCHVWGCELRFKTEHQLEICLANNAIYCIASGDLGEVKKCYFYAREKRAVGASSNNSGDVFMAEVTIRKLIAEGMSATTNKNKHVNQNLPKRQSLSVIFKSTAASTPVVADFVAIFRASLDPMR